MPSEDRWQQIESLYHRARSWEPAIRAERLTEACADDVELRREVEELLEQDNRPGQILDDLPWKPMQPPFGEASGLRAGVALGAYEIEAALGVGGMGEVWKARDHRLDRTVAIKMSHAAFSGRVEREAKAVAALNHPNVAALYDVGIAPSGLTYLVMEYVEGSTLADRISQGPMSSADALPIALQIAEAIEAAHERGIVHRDLKPANIKLKPDGTIKVLDFGLAKALDHGAESASNPELSAPGSITGTPAYMSPEQALGKVADRRSDIWSFGVVLHELLTGKRLFVGDTAGEIIEAVVKKDCHLDGVPVHWQGLLGRCLTKDPRQRLQSIGEARIALERGLDERFVTPVPARTRGAWPWIATTVAATSVALAVLAVLYLRKSPSAEAPPETRLEIGTPATNDPRSFALSPDGRWLAYVASVDGQSRLWVRPMASTTAQALTVTEGGAAYPFWSPDSRSIGFFSGGKLKRIDIGSRAPQAVADAQSGRGGTWNADGTILFVPTAASPIFRVAATGGTAVPVTRLDWSGSHRFPQFLPDNRHFLFYAEGTPEKQTNLSGSIYVGSLDASETRRLTTADTAGLYMSPSWLLWVRGGALVAARVDLERAQLSSDPITVAESVFFDTSHARLFSVSGTGLLAYRQGTPTVQLTWFDRTGKTLGAVNPPADNDGFAPSNTRISPDGHAVIVHRRVHDQTDLWLLDGVHANRLTFSGAVGGVWSPDGRHIAFQEDVGPSRRFYVKSSDGTRNEAPILELPSIITVAGFQAVGAIVEDWSRDGRFLLCESLSSQTGYDLWVIPLEGDRKPRAVLRTKYDEKLPRFSPDGRWVAYVSNESGRAEIHVRTFTDPTAARDRTDDAEWQVSLAGGTFPTWRRDARELYFVAPDGRIMAVPISATGKMLQPGPPVALFQSRIYGGGLDVNTGGSQFDVAPDGRFLVNTVVDTSASSITLLQNWSQK